MQQHIPSDAAKIKELSALLREVYKLNFDLRTQIAALRTENCKLRTLIN